MSTVQSFCQSLSKITLVFHRKNRRQVVNFTAPLPAEAAVGLRIWPSRCLDSPESKHLHTPQKEESQAFSRDGLKLWKQIISKKTSSVSRNGNHGEIRSFDPCLSTTQHSLVSELCHDLPKQLEIPLIKLRAAELTVFKWKSWYVDTENDFGMVHVAMLIRI